MSRVGAGLRVLLPFSDDSTLFFADRMRRVLARTGAELRTAWLVSGTDLSYRQLTSVLPGGPDIVMRNDAFREPALLAGIDALVVSRMFPPLRDMMRKHHLRLMSDRPAVISFQGGLDFDPERGFFNRRHADAVFLLPKGDIVRYAAWSKTEDIGSQYVGFGHPTFLMPEIPADLADRRDIYFFAQAISPPSRRGRRHLLEMLGAIARANPDRTVWIKLRHLPHENQDHLHRERYPYPTLMAASDFACPENLKVTADPMDEVLERAALGLTCTSTAAADLVRAGVPTLIYLDYVENYLDPMVAPMRRLFEASGLIRPIDDVLHLRPTAPDPAWLETMFVPPETLAANVVAAVDAFRARPVQVAEQIPPPDVG